MSKERLEEIEKNLDPLGYGMGGHLINVNDIYWLVKYAREQSERVEELEEEVDRLNGALHYQLSQENIRNEENRKLKYKNKRYREALDLLVKQETLGKDVKTGKTAISYNGMIALKGLGIFNDNNYIVYGVDEIIENVLDGHKRNVLHGFNKIK